MSMFKTIFNSIFAVIFGALGALLFVVFLLPQLLTNPYFENYQFVKDFKQGKIVVNQTDKVYIQEDTALQNAIERVKPSVVAIQSPAIGMVSGLVATSDGNIITLASAVPRSGTVQVFLQGEEQNASVVKIDVKNNLALLKIDKNNLPTVAFSDVGNIKLGQRVFLTSATSVKMDHWFANEGIIREIDKDSLTGALQPIKTTIIEKPTVAGGPLFNSAGELTGLSFIDAEGKISAILVDKIQALLGL